MRKIAEASQENLRWLTDTFNESRGDSLPTRLLLSEGLRHIYNTYPPTCTGWALGELLTDLLPYVAQQPSAKGNITQYSGSQMLENETFRWKTFHQLNCSVTCAIPAKELGCLSVKTPCLDDLKSINFQNTDQQLLLSLNCPSRETLFNRITQVLLPSITAGRLTIFNSQT